MKIQCKCGKVGTLPNDYQGYVRCRCGEVTTVTFGFDQAQPIRRKTSSSLPLVITLCGLLAAAVMAVYYVVMAGG